jgi:hypothetical protein
MLYYSKMRWKLDGMSFNDLWKLENYEAQTAAQSIQAGIVKHLYKVCAEQYVISIGSTSTVEDFDRYAHGILPMREHLIFEEVVPLTEGFTIEIFPYLSSRRAALAEKPRFLHTVEIAWPSGERRLDEVWPTLTKKLKASDAPFVLGVYRYSGRQTALAVIDIAAPAEIDALAVLPELAGATIVKVWAMRDYIGFAADVATGYTFGAGT